MMNQNSGGWRYGNGGSNQFLYRNENVDNDLLKRAAEVAAPKGLLDTKIEAAPLDKFLQPGSETNSGSDGFGGTQNTNSFNSNYSGYSMPNDGDNALGTTATGMSNTVAGKLGSMAAGLLGMPSPIGYAAGIGLNGLIGSKPGTMPNSMSASMMQMDAQAAENDANRFSGLGRSGLLGFTQPQVDQAMSQMDAQAAENEANRLGSLRSRFGGASGSGSSFGSSNYGGNDAHNGDSSHGTRGY